jgi:uncharacterized protein (UPF0212 family)
VAAVSDVGDVLEGTHLARVALTCPECGEKVDFPFYITILFTVSDTGLPMEVINTGHISDTALFDHKLERHGPDAEGLSLS